MFTAWLTSQHVRGIVSEVGWSAGPDAASWNALAQAWYADADAAHLEVTAWASGPFAPGDSHQIYSRSSLWPTGGVDSTTPQSSVVEAHPSTASYLRGVAVSGGSFDDGLHDAFPFSSTDPGTYGTNYFYETPATFPYLASRGIKVVRIDFKWERLQPYLGAPFDAAELARLHAVVAAARTAGLQVILDLHNYGAYQNRDAQTNSAAPIGSAEVPISAFTDLWSRLATEFRSDPGIAAYGLMNEPHDLPGGAPAWERASQAALDAIRATGDRHEVHVPGYNWSQVQTWATSHPSSWIVDPADNFRYDAHQYFDADRTGVYALSYAQELAALRPA